MLNEAGPAATAAQITDAARAFTGPLLWGPPKLVCRKYQNAPSVCNDEVQFFRFVKPGTPAHSAARPVTRDGSSANPVPRVRSDPSPGDEYGVGSRAGSSAAEPVAAIYRRALPQVYGYLLPRCGSAAVAEDLTAETFMAAVAAARDGRVPDLTVAWLVGVARHKLADHWRRLAREEKGLAAVAGLAAADAGAADPWEEVLDAQVAYAALATLPVPQRAALTLRYLDGLAVPEVAEHLGRSVRATETLLVRSRAALRALYREEGSDG